MDKLRGAQAEHGRDPGFVYILNKMQQDTTRSAPA
jgi:hypothetical protein